MPTLLLLLERRHCINVWQEKGKEELLAFDFDKSEKLYGKDLLPLTAVTSQRRHFMRRWYSFRYGNRIVRRDDVFFIVGINEDCNAALMCCWTSDVMSDEYVGSTYASVCIFLEYVFDIMHAR